MAGEEKIEVEAAEVGPHPRPPRQAIVIRYVGVERRVDQVEPHAHPADLATAVAQRSRVTELVEDAS